VDDSVLGTVECGQDPKRRAPQPFEVFFRREYRRLVALGLALTGDRGRAEELAQDTLLAVHRRWDDLAVYDAPGAWARRVLLNRARSAWRRRRAEASALERYARVSEEPGVYGPEPALDVETFWSHVRRLPRRQAQCIALRYVDELTTAEIGHVLGCENATVRVHLHRARAELAKRLNVEEAGDDD
jgi:RNA polymerase sigma-70 factor (ECF subfamily)